MRQLGIHIIKSRQYIFGLPTKGIELFSGICAFFFSMVFLIGGSLPERFNVYKNFEYIDHPIVWVGMLAISIVQLRVVWKDTLESNIASAILLRVSCFIWFVCALLFGVDGLMLNTAFFTYSTMAFICLAASFEITARNKNEDLVRNECRNG